LVISVLFLLFQAIIVNLLNICSIRKSKLLLYLPQILITFWQNLSPNQKTGNVPMKMNPRCTYCLLSRVHFQSRLSTDDEDLISKTIQECLKVLTRHYRSEEHTSELQSRE